MEEQPKKSNSKVIMIVIAAAVGLLLLCCITSTFMLMRTGSDTDSNDSNDTQETNREEESQNEESTEIVEVNITEFVKEFDDNQLAAEKKYEGKIVKVSGVIDNISEDIMGDYFLSLQPPGDEFYFGTQVQCFFEDSESIISLTNGTETTVIGEFDTQSFNVIMRNCKLAQ